MWSRLVWGGHRGGAASDSAKAAAETGTTYMFGRQKSFETAKDAALNVKGFQDMSFDGISLGSFMGGAAVMHGGKTFRYAFMPVMQQVPQT